MRRTLWTAAVGLLLLSAAALAADGTVGTVGTVGTDDRIASLYVHAAHEAYLEGETDRAMRLVEVAREFGPSSSDALYLTAMLQASDRHRVADSIDLLRTSLEIGGWQQFSSFAARVLLGRLLNRVQRPSEALTTLAAADRTPATAESLLAEFYFEHALALHRLDRIQERDALLAVARDRFPDEYRLFWFELMTEPFPSIEYRRELERLLGEHSIDASRTAGPGWPGSGGRPQAGDLLLEYALRAPVDTDAAWAVGELDRIGWIDPAVALLFVDEEPERAVERFLAAGGMVDYAVWRALHERVPPEQQAVLREYANGYSGESTIDYERDGVWNERIVVDSGSVRSWEIDADQNGTPEVVVEFDESEPIRLALAFGDSEVNLDYGQYPFLVSADMRVEAGTERFVLRPRAVRVDAVIELPTTGPEFGSSLSPIPTPRAVERRELVAAAIRVDLVQPDGTITERTYHSGGSMRAIQRDTNGDGNWDHLLLTDGGFATRGLRDIDHDGYFEVAEGYRNGSLVVLAVDSDDDGVPEVFERERGVPVREWDLNEDGRIDVREFAWWTDSVVREFPIAEDGR